VQNELFSKKFQSNNDMSKAKLEYIWLDGYTPTQELRSKTKIVSDFDGKLESCSDWSFDGSSTLQAEGNSSDCILRPVNLFPDPDRLNGYLVMCEVMNPDGTPHVSNHRATIDDDDNDFWFGFEQEYFLMDTETDLPLGFPRGGFPGPQGQYYCSVGGRYTWGRDFVEEHLDICLEAGLNVEGINQEVAPGQWEFQIFAKGAKEAGDQIWVARYLLNRVTTLNYTPNRFMEIGTVLECTPTSRTHCLELPEAKKFTKKFARPLDQLQWTTSQSMVPTTTSV
jgi:glutamine synthetase